MVIHCIQNHNNFDILKIQENNMYIIMTRSEPDLQLWGPGVKGWRGPCQSKIAPIIEKLKIKKKSFHFSEIRRLPTGVFVGGGLGPQA